MDNKYKHLMMIENIVNKMGSNAFMLKGWTVTLVVGIFALSGKETNSSFLYIAYIPIVLFWILDIYYLRLERIYKEIYNIVRRKSDDNIDFDMKRDSYVWKCNRTSILSCIKSPSIWLFYLLLALVVLLFILLMKSQINNDFINGKIALYCYHTV
jgi:hypothetical protein